MLNYLKTLQWRQILTSISVNYVMIPVGMSLVWTSPVLTELHGPDSPLSRLPTVQEEEWIASLMLLGGTFGPLVLIPLTRHIGRRTIIRLLNAPLLLAWLVAGLATNVYCLYAARFLWGCTMGSAFMIIPLYIAEIAEDSIRGALGAMFAQHLYIGFFLGFLVGRFTSYWGLAITGGCISLLYLVTSWSIPESPFYLVYKGCKAEAEVVLHKLRHHQPVEETQQELENLEKLVEQEYLVPPQISDLWASSGSVRALGICIFLCVLIQLSGINVILFYLEELFAKVKVNLKPRDAPLVIGAMQAISSNVTPLVVERVGRRFLLYSTLFGMTTALGVMGIYSVLESHYQEDVSAFTSLPIICLVVYIVLFTWGLGPIPFVLVAEMFRPKVKCLASGLCAALCWFSGFLLTRFYSDITDKLGEYTGFWMLAAFCLGGALFSFFLLPETQGKTFEEIQGILNRTYDWTDEKIPPAC